MDATRDDAALGPGRLINHSTAPNLRPEKVQVDGAPHIAFIAKRDIAAGEELFFDYGDRRPSIVKEQPWLAPVNAKARKTKASLWCVAPRRPPAR